MVVALGAIDRFGAVARSICAALLAALLLVGGAALAGVQYPVVASALRAQMLDAVNAVPGVAALPAEQLATVRTAADWTARVFPALVLVGATLGGALASAVAARVAPSPRLEEPGPFREFRFSDQLVWGAVATFAVSLTDLPEAGRTLVANLLLCWGALYAARGFAVLASLAARWSAFPRRGLFIALVALLPYSLGAAVVMGLADTWIDFRRVRTPPPSGGMES